MNYFFWQLLPSSKADNPWVLIGSCPDLRQCRDEKRW